MHSARRGEQSVRAVTVYGNPDAEPELVVVQPHVPPGAARAQGWHVPVERSGQLLCVITPRHVCHGAQAGDSVQAAPVAPVPVGKHCIFGPGRFPARKQDSPTAQSAFAQSPPCAARAVQVPHAPAANLQEPLWHWLDVAQAAPSSRVPFRAHAAGWDARRSVQEEEGDASAAVHVVRLATVKVASGAARSFMHERWKVVLHWATLWNMEPNSVSEHF